MTIHETYLPHQIIDAELLANLNEFGSNAFISKIETLRIYLLEQIDEGFECGEYRNVVHQLESILNYLLHRNVRRASKHLYEGIPEHDFSVDVIKHAVHPIQSFKVVVKDFTGEETIELNDIVPRDVIELIRTYLYDPKDEQPLRQWLIKQEDHEIIIGIQRSKYDVPNSQFFIDLIEKIKVLREVKRPVDLLVLDIDDVEQPHDEIKKRVYSVAPIKREELQQRVFKLYQNISALVVEHTGQEPFSLGVTLPGAIFFSSHGDTELKEKIYEELKGLYAGASL